MFSDIILIVKNIELPRLNIMLQYFICILKYMYKYKKGHINLFRQTPVNNCS